MTPIKFSKERQERFLELVASGESMAAAAAEVGVSPQTISAWRTKARNGTEPYVSFARRLDEIGSGPPLEREDLVRLLERQARNGSIRAIQLLLERRWEAGDKSEQIVAEFQQRVRERFGLVPTNGNDPDPEEVS